MNAQRQLNVLLITEGTYPYVGGGVSTWCDSLIRELKSVHFSIIAVTGAPISTMKYVLPSNVRYLRQVPMWGSEEPSEYIQPERSFADIYTNRTETTDEVISEKFIPVFEEFLEDIVDPNRRPPRPEVIFRLYKYFRQYEYKTTFRSSLTWETFRAMVLRTAGQWGDLSEEQPSLFDVTTALRWLYSFMLPLSVALPRVDIAHATLASPSCLAVVAAKYEFGARIVVTDHGIFIRERYIALASEKLSRFAKRFILNLSSYATRMIYTCADQISPVCEYNQRWELRFGGSRDRIRTIYNGIDPGIFTPRQKPEKTLNRPTVVAVARIFPLKDIETMVHSCAEVRKEIPDVQYIVYGPADVDLPYTERCMALIRNYALEKNFIFGGFHPKPHEVYNEGDISILSSISEGFPYTVIESMACARPVVATDVGGVREAVEAYGLLARPRDAAGLAEGVVTLLRDHELRQGLGKLSRDRVLLRYRTTLAMNEYLVSYERLAADNQIHA
ncbi:MAG TPA: GT4 family glycosyltransferase PelF [Bacteroidota bacterium]|nr:GT4 family glycosyltransferase PelF [Bacteroidota bacterium]